MTLGQLMPFREALNTLAARTVLPTSLDTATLRQMEAGIRRQSFFSAQTLMEDLLNQYKSDVRSLLNPQTVLRDGRQVTEGLDPATARLRAKELLTKLGYQPDPEELDTLKDLSSDARINLVLKTNTQMMQGAGNFIKANDPSALEAFPAQELVRFESREKTRDWKTRWLMAAESSGDTDASRILGQSGRMIARKDSPIWDALGSSDLFPDGLDNPYPPFAFNSGMWVQDVDFDTAESFGLVTLDNTPEPQQLDIESLFGKAA